MAGASVNIDIDDQSLQHFFQQMLNKSNDLEDVFADIGELLNESTHQRFEAQVAPDGEAWAELSDVTKSRKTKNEDKILVESGDLMESFVYNASSDQLIFGSNKVYAAMQQFGGTTSMQSMFPGKKIEARPFLGISSDDEQSISDLLVQSLLD